MDDLIIVHFRWNSFVRSVSILMYCFLLRTEAEWLTTEKTTLQVVTKALLQHMHFPCGLIVLRFYKTTRNRLFYQLMFLLIDFPSSDPVQVVTLRVCCGFKMNISVFKFNPVAQASTYKNRKGTYSKNSLFSVFIVMHCKCSFTITTKL